RHAWPQVFALGDGREGAASGRPGAGVSYRETRGPAEQDVQPSRQGRRERRAIDIADPVPEFRIVKPGPGPGFDLPAASRQGHSRAHRTPDHPARVAGPFHGREETVSNVLKAGVAALFAVGGLATPAFAQSGSIVGSVRDSS